MRGEKVGRIALEALNRIVEHAPADMTVSVEAGITLARLQSELARARQWLPIDPPSPERLTIGALLATNASGPRRFGCGTIRDHLIGIRVALADGRLIQSGGRVVKNVAGYDLAKLFVGSHGSLGVVVEATFKLRPLPEAEQFVRARCGSLQEAGELLESIFESEITPVALDFHDLPSMPAPRSPLFSLVAGFAGTVEEVEWQRARAAELSLNEATTLDHENHFWNGDSPPRRVSVAPSKVIETIRVLGDVPFVARAGNGVVYYRGGPPPVKEQSPVGLMQRLKSEFDPRHILPELAL